MVCNVGGGPCYRWQQDLLWVDSWFSVGGDQGGGLLNTRFALDGGGGEETLW
jgi:hypothetical protein